MADRLWVPTAYERILADAPWWDYLQVWTRADGTAYVKDEECERVESFASEDAAIVWARQKAEALYVRPLDN